MYPEIILKEPIHHPQALRGSRTSLMGENMTQNRVKNSLKQPKTSKSAFGSIHHYRNSNIHNMDFHTVFGKFFQSPNAAGFNFSYLQPTFPQNHHPNGGIPPKSEFSKAGAQVQFFVCVSKIFTKIS